VKDRLKKLLKTKEEARAALLKRADEAKELSDLEEIKKQLEAISAEIADIAAAIAEPEPAKEEDGESARTAAVSGVTESRSYVPGVGFKPVGGGGLEDRQQKELESSEKRGKDLKEGRAVTVGASSIVLPRLDSNVINPTFNQVSGLLDRVDRIILPGGESYRQPYEKTTPDGAYTAEGVAAANTDVTFGYADMLKTKITSYSEESEEVAKLPAAPYDSVIIEGISRSLRKKITKEILLGAGSTNSLSGIFSATATAIDATTDLELAAIDNETLDEIIFSYGYDENVEEQAVLILNKADLKAFAQLRNTDGGKFHDIKTNGNSGTIDGIPFIINSACKAVTAATTAAGNYCMAYGLLTNYKLAIFSDVDVKRSEDYKFREGMIAHRGVVFIGGNVVAANGFLRVKKAAVVE
jgi:HK97 family phage major capsid protein